MLEGSIGMELIACGALLKVFAESNNSFFSVSSVACLAFVLLFLRVSAFFLVSWRAVLDCAALIQATRLRGQGLQGQGHFEEADGVEGRAAGEVGDLVAATGAVGDEEVAFGGGADGGEEGGFGHGAGDFLGF